jgi:hypothetical protein
VFWGEIDGQTQAAAAPLNPPPAFTNEEDHALYQYLGECAIPNWLSVCDRFCIIGSDLRVAWLTTPCG